jgi:NADH-quinone oxidoreductase subunit N
MNRLLLQNIDDLVFLLPEGIWLLLIVVLLLLSWQGKNSIGWQWLFGIGVVAELCVLLLRHWQTNADVYGGPLFSGALWISSENSRFQFFSLLLALPGLFLLLRKSSDAVKAKPEWGILLASVLLSGQVLLMSREFTIWFISVEFLSLSVYTLVAMGGKEHATWASFRYLWFGGLAAGLSLLGISLYYGVQNSILLDAFPLLAPATIILPITFMLLGVLWFKVAAVPLHGWVPEVYSQSGFRLASFLTVYPKAVALMAMFQLIQWLGGIPDNLRYLVMAVGGLTLLVGTIGALRQQRFILLLAYSAIAQSGFMLLAFASPNAPSDTLLFYLFAYAPAVYLVFYLGERISAAVGSDDLALWSGLGKSHIGISLLLSIGLVSLLGLPPTLGFFAKLAVFIGLWKTFSEGGVAYGLVLMLALSLTLPGLYYYLRPLYFVFLKPSKRPTILTSPGIFQWICLILITVPLLLGFLWPEWVLEIPKLLLE